MLCCRVQNQLSAYSDNELSGAEMLQIRRHLSECRSCTSEHQQLLQMKLLMGALTEPRPRQIFRLQEIERRAQVAPPRPKWVRVVSEWVRFTLSGVPRVQPGTPFLALSSGLALSCMVLGVLGAPQRPDAVAAHVPAQVSDEDRGTTARLPQEVAQWAPAAWPAFSPMPYVSGDRSELVSYHYYRTVRLPYGPEAAPANPLLLNVSYEDRLSDLSQSPNNFSR